MQVRSMRVVLAFLLLLGAWVSAGATISITTVGSPRFEAVDLHMFAAPFGTLADNYAEFSLTQTRLLPPPNHVTNPTLGIGPGAPHPGPYDHEMGQGVAANGFVETSDFTMDQYSNGSGVYLVFMLVPGPGSATGKSPDFASGPILANAMFPMTVKSDTYTNGTFNDVLGDFTVPALNTVQGFETVDGHSHIPLFFADNIDFAKNNKNPGSYEFRVPPVSELELN